MARPQTQTHEQVLYQRGVCLPPIILGGCGRK